MHSCPNSNNTKLTGRTRNGVILRALPHVFVGIVACGLLCSGCSYNAQRAHQPRPGNKYATGFQIDDTMGIRRVRVFAPWQADSVMATYLLMPDSVQLPSLEGTRLPLPLTRIGASSATHIGMLSELGLLDKLAGMCNPEVSYHTLPDHCQHFGDAMQPDPERIIRYGTQAMLYSTYAPSDQSAERLEAVGIPVLYNNEWREVTPLARAEWIRFIAAFFDVLPQADSLFAVIDSSYCALRDKKSETNNEKSVSVVSGLDFRGTWYVPAGGTYMGALFKDAGADYVFADDPRDSSIPLTFEQALLSFADADVWLGCNVPSREALIEMNSQHALFKAYKTGRLYNFRKRCLPSGANDFWESGVVHPERILQDIIATLEGDTSFYYINSVK